MLPKGLALTGRIRSFLENPTKRLPVSCTVRVVKNSLEDLAYTFRFTSYALRHGAGVSIHLSDFDAASNIPSADDLDVFFYIHPDHPDADKFYKVQWTTGQQIDNAVVVPIEDSMDEYKNGAIPIEEAWTHLLRIGKGRFVYDFSRLRPEGADNGKGLVSSGAHSFAKIMADIYRMRRLYAPHRFAALISCFSRINEVLRRGGLYKNGAIVVHYDYDRPYIERFLSMTREEAPWVRLAVNVDSEVVNSPYKTAILQKVAMGDLFMVKKVYHRGQRIYHNVCLEVLLPDRGTCLLAHVNLGALKVEEIPTSFEQSMQWLCEFHGKTGIDKYYLPPAEDRQVGLGVIGLANLLSYYSVKYRDFVNALDYILNNRGNPSQEALRIASAIRSGYERAAEVAHRYRMQRAFAIAPTANTSYAYTDMLGYVTTPEISPPVDREVVRVSETTDEITVTYPPTVEIASEVGWDVYWRLIDLWMQMMNMTGLAHSISSNWWSDQVSMNDKFLISWLTSSWRSLYYALPVEPAVDKSDIMCDIDCQSCAE